MAGIITVEKGLAVWVLGKNLDVQIKQDSKDRVVVLDGAGPFIVQARITPYVSSSQPTFQNAGLSVTVIRGESFPNGVRIDSYIDKDSRPVELEEGLLLNLNGKRKRQTFSIPVMGITSEVIHKRITVEAKKLPTKKKRVQTTK